MKIEVRVRPSAKQTKVEQTSEGEYKVWVREPAEKGLANKAVVRAIADFFDVSQSRVRVAQGGQSSKKIIEII